jgi:hypothetical protein
MDLTGAPMVLCAERAWFGGLAGALTGKLIESKESLPQSALDLVATAFGGALVDPAVVELVLGSIDLLSETDLFNVCVDLLLGQIGSHSSKQTTAINQAAASAASALRLAHTDVGAPKRGPTLLLLGPELQQLPWESFRCLRGQAVTRMPCLPLVIARLQQVRRGTVALPVRYGICMLCVPYGDVYTSFTAARVVMAGLCVL